MAEALQNLPVARAVIDLSANENPLGPSPKVAAAIQAEITGLHRYPSREGTRLRALLSQQLDLESNQLLLGNGASELLDIAARVLLQPSDEAIIPVPSFMPYQKVVVRAGANAVTVSNAPGPIDLDAIEAAITPRTRLILLGNPNNPTGSYIDAPALDAFLARVPDGVLVVIDEAYVEYVTATDYPDALQRIRCGAPLLVLRSLSKAWGLAGLRIGYGVGQPELIARLNACCQFYNTNALAQAAACAALQDQDHLRRTRDLNQRSITYLTSALEALGLRVWPSQANFLLVDLSPHAIDSEQLVDQLARRGLLLKPMGRFGLPHCLRVSTGLMHDNRAFIEALSNLLRRLPCDDGTENNNDKQEQRPW
ncbi:histidinol-phosphate transaminase [Motiliproteus sediminis]|uniref:histidinol-phosphate transaminase n=1 Tax=Motiliproteus sediminis TaxID=1468178 RepID=UPI001AEFC67F|nr:histidinol-phosphate transaminase [Motiliproteus sediminis]